MKKWGGESVVSRLEAAIAFNFKLVDYHGIRLVMLEIPAAASRPVEFERQAFIRIGSATPRLSDHPERLKTLWAKLHPMPGKRASRHNS